MYQALRVLCRLSFSERRNSMLVFIVCDMTQARRARATVCKAGPILGIRRTNRCKGRVHSRPRVTARISSASVMPTTATKAAYLASPLLPISPNPNGSICAWFMSLMNPMIQISSPTIENGQEQFDGRPGDGRQEVPPQRDLVLVVIGQLLENFAEVARLLAHVHHFAEQRRKEIARGRQPRAEGLALVDHLADGRQMPAGTRPRAFVASRAQIVRSSIPASRHIDARWLNPASCLSDIRGLKSMMRVHRGSGIAPDPIVSHSATA